MGGALQTMRRHMKIVQNPDNDYFNEMVEKLSKNDGYCPCRVAKTPDTKCMCKEFREQIKNKIPGMCHCGMYLLKEDD